MTFQDGLNQKDIGQKNTGRKSTYQKNSGQKMFNCKDFLNGNTRRRFVGCQPASNCTEFCFVSDMIHFASLTNKIIVL